MRSNYEIFNWRKVINLNNISQIAIAPAYADAMTTC